jgi:hypothetical protein
MAHFCVLIRCSLCGQVQCHLLAKLTLRAGEKPLSPFPSSSACRANPLLSAPSHFALILLTVKRSISGLNRSTEWHRELTCGQMRVIAAARARLALFTIHQSAFDHSFCAFTAMFAPAHQSHQLKLPWLPISSGEQDPARPAIT